MILLLTISLWFIWSYQSLGSYQTFLGNTSYEWQQGATPIQFMDKNIFNFKYTLLPFLPDYHLDYTYQEEFPIMLYDNVFSVYNVSLPGSLTFTLAIIGLAIILSNYKRILKNLFFSSLIIFSILVGAVSAPLLYGGIAHITVYPASLLLLSIILTFIFRNLQQIPKIITGIILLFFLTESVFNIILRIIVTRTYLYFPILHNSYTNILPVHINNFKLKMDNNLIFLFDRFINYQLFFILLCLMLWLFFAFILFKHLILSKNQGK